MFLIQGILFIVFFILLQEVKPNEIYGDFEVEPQDHFIEIEEDEATVNNFKRVISKNEWRHMKGYLKAMKQETGGYVKNANYSKDPSVFCPQLETCHGCVSRKNVCYWCYKTGCSDRKKCINNYNKPKCPIIAHKGKKILIPAGVNYDINVKLNFPDPDIVEKRLLCVIERGERLLYLPAKYARGRIKCDTYFFDTDVSGDIDAGSLRVLWGGFQQYSNQLNIFIYRCNIMATDCVSCGILPLEYGCSWCRQQNYCTTAAQCRPGARKWSVNVSCLSDECEGCWTPQN